jgi:hypothetical protein
LKKFVALSSASLVISSCAKPKPSRGIKKKIKKQPKPISTPDAKSKIHPNISTLDQEAPILPRPKLPTKPEPIAVYGPPHIP